jgi:sigma-B regulation protein RsbU (phosphoserine phosphatase)
MLKNDVNGRKISMRSRLALVVSAAIILCFSGFGLYMGMEQGKFAKREIHDLTHAIAENISVAVARDIIEKRIDNIEFLLIRFSMIDNVRELSVTDMNGRVISRVVRNGNSPGKADYSKIAAIPLEVSARSSTSETEYRYVKPIVLSRPIGSVVVTLSLDKLTTVRRNIFIDTARATLIAVILNIILLSVGLRSTVRHLQNATRFAHFLSSHRGAQFTGDCSIVEIHELVSSLNRMSLELATQHQRLVENEVRKSAILEAAMDCFVTIDHNGRIVDFNRAAEKTFGYTANEVIGLVMADLLIPKAMRKAHRQGLAHYILTRESNIIRKRLELTAIRRNGEEFPIETVITPFEVGGRLYFSGYMRDISASKKLEAEKVWVNELLTKMMHELEYQKFALDQHSKVSITDASGNIIYVNEKFTEISGYSASELIGVNHRLLKSHLHEPGFYTRMWQEIGSGRVWHGQIANRGKSGEIYWVSTTIVPWLDEAGLPYQYVSIYTNVSEQKLIEQALAESRKRELDTGYEIQRALLWGSIPENIEKALIATYSEASQGVDGDFFSINRYSDTCFDLLVGDVMGKGLHAALIGAAVKNTYNQILVELLVGTLGQNQLPSPAHIVNALHQSMTPRLITLNSFVTLALYRFDLALGTLTYVNAGHPSGFLVSSISGKAQRILGENMPIGVLENEIYVQQQLPIARGDVLLVYSDGITETRNVLQQEFGEDQLLQLMMKSLAVGLPPNMILQHLRSQLRTFAQTDSLTDDQTMVMIEFSPAQGYFCHVSGVVDFIDRFELPWKLGGLAVLRTRIEQALQELPENDRNGLILASFEAATNVIRHVPKLFPDSAITCRIKRRQMFVEVELLYVGSPFRPAAIDEPDFSGESSGGFGLYIMEQAVDKVIYGTPTPGVCSINLIQHRISVI